MCCECVHHDPCLFIEFDFIVLPVRVFWPRCSENVQTSKSKYWVLTLYRKRTSKTVIITCSVAISSSTTILSMPQSKIVCIFKWVDSRAFTGSRCERSEPVWKMLTLLEHNNSKSERNNIRSIESVMMKSMKFEIFILELHFIVLKNANEYQESC